MMRQSLFKRLVSGLILAVSMWAIPGRDLSAQSVSLDPRRGAQGEIELQVTGGNGNTFVLDHSEDLKTWQPIASEQTLPWLASGQREGRRAGYYRVIVREPKAITSHPSLKTTLALPDDPFRSEPVFTYYDQPEVRWVKFTLLMDNLPEVYFQNSADYTFHYPFAAERLDPYAGISLEEYNTRSLYRSNQELVLGAVLFAPQLGEYAIQLVGQDVYPPEMTRFIIDTVDAAISRPDHWRRFYFPTFEQRDGTLASAPYYQRHGIAIDSIARWQTGNSCYVNGWALGRLVELSAGEIESAFVEGRLTSEDILLTDGVPAEVPFVAGILSTEPATPNSHVAILARAYGIPFAYIADPVLQSQASSLHEKEVVMRARSFFGAACQIDVVEPSTMTQAFREELLALKETPPIDVAAKTSFGSLSRPLETVTPADVTTIGGKAANFGFLRRTLPETSPEAIALTFDLWDAFMGQTLKNGKTLDEEIAGRLAPFRSWPVDIKALSVALQEIRNLIEDEARFLESQRTGVLQALETAGFDANLNIRFRSSTNVEDTEIFVGAGLYDSYSGCLADELDDDDSGPSHCDETEAKERGVFRAIRKVYASFYNLNAYIARLRRGVDESEVGMAILVHHSFPDAFEAANGVITARLTGGFGSRYLEMELVAQVGAHSVTNPDGGSVPEVVIGNGFRSDGGGGIDIYLSQRSSLLRVGEFSVMNWEDDYRELMTKVFDVAEVYRAYVNREGFTLEFEFKKLTDDSLVIKQVREVPEVSGSTTDFAALVGAPVELEVFQGETADVFSNHRLKSRWKVTSKSLWLDPELLDASPLTQGDWEFQSDGEVQSLAGPPSAWPSSRFEVVDDPIGKVARDVWPRDPYQSTKADLTFGFQIPEPYFYADMPIQFLQDFFVLQTAEYETPQLVLDMHEEGVSTTTSETVKMTRAVTTQPLPLGAVPVHREATSTGGVDVSIRFYWPPPPTGAVAGYTAPLQKWEETVITGLTGEPIVLRGYYSQTYRPGHHNFTEAFLFEPRLEKGIAASVLEELENENVKLIYVVVGFEEPKIKAVGFDDSVRNL